MNRFIKPEEMENTVKIDDSELNPLKQDVLKKRIMKWDKFFEKFTSAGEAKTEEVLISDIENYYLEQLNKFNSKTTKTKKVKHFKQRRYIRKKKTSKSKQNRSCSSIDNQEEYEDINSPSTSDYSKMLALDVKKEETTPENFEACSPKKKLKVVLKRMENITETNSPNQTGTILRSLHKTEWAESIAKSPVIAGEEIKIKTKSTPQKTGESSSKTATPKQDKKTLNISKINKSTQSPLNLADIENATDSMDLVNQISMNFEDVVKRIEGKYGNAFYDIALQTKISGNNNYLRKKLKILVNNAKRSIPLFDIYTYMTLIVEYKEIMKEIEEQSLHT